MRDINCLLNWTWSLLGLTLLLVVSGCVPIVVTRVPQINGRVVDAGGNPVPHAVVNLSYGVDSKSTKKVIIRCRGDGGFSRPADVSWGLWLLPMDYYFPVTHFEAVALAGDSKSLPKVFEQHYPEWRIFGLGPVKTVNLEDIVLWSYIP
jgi:hypothetical protein